MKILRQIKYFMIISVKNKGAMFWILAYPLIMISFYNFAFSGLMKMDIDPIPTGIEEGSGFVGFIAEKFDILDIKTFSEKEGINALKHKKIKAFIKADGKLIVRESGPSETIVRQLVSSLNRAVAAGRDGKLDSSQRGFVDLIETSDSENSQVAVMYYALLAMFSIYGMFGASESVRSIQANQSPLGARLSSSAVEKSTFVISAFISSFIVNFAANLLVLLATTVMFKINVVQDLAGTLLVLAMGNIFGICFGLFLGSLITGNESIKGVIMIALSVILASISGMVNAETVVVIKTHLPWLDKINPLRTISRGLFVFNQMEGSGGKFFAQYGWILIAMSAAMLLAAVHLLRRRKYDSI